VLSVFAVGCMTLAAYLCSILQWDAPKYPELIAPASGSAAAAAFALGSAAFILTVGKLQAFLW
jgi:hypothetical protein